MKNYLIINNNQLIILHYFFLFSIQSDALIVSFSNILTSIFAGFAVFSVIGYLAGIADTEVSKVVDQGVGLAFKVYPEVVNKLPFAPFWSFLFFFMLFTLGLDSQFALLETVQTAILDRFPAVSDFY